MANGDDGGQHLLIMLIGDQLGMAISDVFGHGILKLVSEKSEKSQGILLSMVCGNPVLS